VVTVVTIVTVAAAEEEAAERVLSLEKVSKEYKRSGAVLSAVDLEVREKDFIVIRGRSGIGKSTLLRIMGLLDAPTSGKVLVDGRDTSTMGDAELSRLRLRTFGFVFQQFNLIPSLTNLENVELPMQLAGVSPRERTRRALDLLASFGVEPLATRHPTQISGGEQQRVCIARALANRPKVVLADEPTASLDESNSDAVLRLFRRVNLEDDVAIVLTTTSDSDRFSSTIEFRIREARLGPCDAEVSSGPGVSGGGVGGDRASVSGSNNDNNSNSRGGTIDGGPRRVASTDPR
jgi:putative ABC transport system ATP-binding protein